MIVFIPLNSFLRNGILSFEQESWKIATTICVTMCVILDCETIFIVFIDFGKAAKFGPYIALDAIDQ